MYELMRLMDVEAPSLRKNVGQSYDTSRPWCVWVFLHGDKDARAVHSLAEWRLLQLTELEPAQ